MEEKEIIRNYLLKARNIINFHKICMYIVGPIVVAVLLYLKSGAQWINQLVLVTATIYLLTIVMMNAYITNVLLVCPICGEHFSETVFKKTVKDVPEQCPHCGTKFK